MQLLHAERRPKDYVPTDTDKAAFTASAAHLLRQNAKAEGKTGVSYSNNCMYLAEDGKRCAVGGLLDMAKYNPSIEGYGVCSEKVQAALLDAYCWAHNKMLSGLQAVHDRYQPADWAECLWALAVYWGFDPTEVLPAGTPPTTHTAYEVA